MRFRNAMNGNAVFHHGFAAPLGLVLAALFLPTAPASAAVPTPTTNPHRAPLYWTPYEYNWLADGRIPENEWSANIDWVDQNLKSYGYKMICIDGWGEDWPFNGDGYRLKHSTQWTHDYAWWSAHLQSRGMTLGIYNNPLWVSRMAANDGLKIKGTNINISSIIDTNEPGIFTWVQVDRPGAEQYVKGYVRFYADMGVKYLRVDFLSWYENGRDHGDQVGRLDRPRWHYELALRWMKEACDANGMILSLVMPHLYNEAEYENAYGHMYRVNEDVWDGKWYRFSQMNRGSRQPWWSQWSNPFDGFVWWSRYSGRGKVILDGDFQRLNTFGNDNERKSVVSLNLIAGGPLAVADRYNSINGHLWLYQNTELLALNTDKFVGKPFSNDPNSEDSQRWKGQMSNDDWVVGLFNREDSPRQRSVDFASDLGLSGGAEVRDLWLHQDLGSMSSYSVSVPARGVVVLRIRVPQAPTATRTPSATSTVPAPTATATPSSSPTASSTPSASRTASSTASRTASPSRTPSASRTRTPSASPSSTATPSASPSPSPSFTTSPTPSRTLSNTPVPIGSTETATPTATPDWSATPSATQTPSPSLTASVSPSQTATPSDSPSPSLTPTESPTPTFTPQPSASASSTKLPSGTPSMSPSPAASPQTTATRTATAAATATATPSPTPTFQPGSSATPSPLPSASPTQVSIVTAKTPPTHPPQGRGRVLECRPGRNPQTGRPFLVSVKLDGRVEDLELRIYSQGYILCASSWLSGGFDAGWQNLAFDAPALPNGTYFFQVLPLRGQDRPGPAASGKTMILK